MLKKSLLKKVLNVEMLAQASKFRRLLAHPFRYMFAILFRELIYAKTKREVACKVSTFFDTKMHLLLPSSTDIYLCGGKTHDSEIRLAKFLVQEVKEGDCFLDLGAHYGYFSLLASKIVGKTGQVHSFEPSPKTFNILQKNEGLQNNISAYNLAVSDLNEDLIFHEFPNLYSEYNAINIEQFKDASWYQKNQAQKIKVKSVKLDDFIAEKKLFPAMIKIDVEGAEFKVISGMMNFLQENAPILIVEFLESSRGNKEHKLAEKELNSLGYVAHKIDSNGELIAIHSASSYVDSSGLESDNIVYKKMK